jgi:two-component system, NtrC family, nitrogen regulation sensor histidine kinase NtrY
LQRRFGSATPQDAEMFKRLTSTIIRQVGDLRRMVDEFSSFARMPKPLFKNENLADIVRQSVFLHEVATPAIQFSVTGSADVIDLVCDRRLLSQCFMNVLKNAVEAIERVGRDDGEISVSISTADNAATVSIEDNGEGLPADRASIVEPYVTTREGGTGLGLAIVKRIVEEHGGTLSFADRDGGGTRTIITLASQDSANPMGTLQSGESVSGDLSPAKAQFKPASRKTSSEGNDHGA